MRTVVLTVQKAVACYLGHLAQLRQCTLRFGAHVTGGFGNHFFNQGTGTVFVANRVKFFGQSQLGF